MKLPRVRIAVSVLVVSLAACRDDPGSPQHWEKRLSGAKRSRDKMRVLEELRESGKLAPTFTPMLCAELERERLAAVKGAIAKLLGTLKDPSSVGPLTSAIDFGNSDASGNAMNREIANALGRIGDSQSIPAVLRMLGSRDPYTEIEAINALGALKAKPAVEPLIEIIVEQRAEPFIVKKAIQALGEIGDPRAVPALVPLLFMEKRGGSFYVESSFALFQIGRPASDALLAVLRGEDKKLLSWARQNSVITPAIYAKAAQLVGDFRDQRAEQALISQLGFRSEFIDLKLFVRMRAADALGRLRSAAAVGPLQAMLNEEEPPARQEYIRALTRIGSRDAIPGMVKAASAGHWNLREPTAAGLAMLGDARELPALEKLIANEGALTKAECAEDSTAQGCANPEELAKSHLAVLQRDAKVLQAATACHADVSCWSKQLDHDDPLIRQRAALEIGRSKQGAQAAELIKRIGEKNLEVRLALIQAATWLMDNSSESSRPINLLQLIDKQLADDQGKTEFVRVNEDLRRLAIELKRHQA